MMCIACGHLVNMKFWHEICAACPLLVMNVGRLKF